MADPLSIAGSIAGLVAIADTIFTRIYRYTKAVKGAAKEIQALGSEITTLSGLLRNLELVLNEYEEQQHSSCRLLLFSLAAQLARQDETAFAHLQKLYEKHHPIDSGTILLEISALVKTVSQQSSCFQDVSIVVDGLDECGDHTTDVVQSLAGLATLSGSNIRALFLSRDEYDIRELLQQDFGNVKIAAHKEDLELYVAAEIESRRRKAGREQLRIRSSELKDHIIKSLVNGADGMFRWAACQLDLLSGIPTDAAKRQALKSLPPTLFKTYERILERIGESSSCVQEMVQNTLKWILHSRGMIPAAQICEAVSIKESDIVLDKESLYEQEDILLHCSSLIRLSSSGKYFQLAHFTVKEFLESLSESSGALFAPYSQAKDHVHPHLAKICLTYIKLDVFRRDVIEDFDTWQDQQTQYPFRVHAVHNWVDYAKHAWNDERIRGHARELFCLSRTSSFLSWARDYIYTRRRASHETEVGFKQVTKLICMGRVNPLHMASAIGCVELCKWLLDLDCSIDQVSSIGTPVHCALNGALRYAYSLEGDYWLDEPHNFMKEGRAEVLDLLIQRGADIFILYRDIHGNQYSCLTLAVNACMGRGVDHPLVKLVDAGSKLDDSVMGSLEKAARYAGGHAKQMVEALIANLNKNAQEDCVKSEILRLALQMKSSAAIELVKNKTQAYCHMDLEDLLNPIVGFGEFNETPLHQAAEHESTNAILLLLTLGVEVDARDVLGLTPLHYAAAKKTSDEHTMSLLLSNGASTAIRDRIGRTVWHIAAENDNAVGLKTLIRMDDSKQESRFLPDENGVIPLFTAAIELHNSAFEMLLGQMEVGQHLRTKCPNGIGLVHYAVSMNSIKLLQMLNDKGGELHQRADDGRTGLHFIPEHVDQAIVQMLIDIGLSPAMLDYDGKTPLHILIQNEVEIGENVFDMLATNPTIGVYTKTGLTVLHFTVSVGTKTMVDYGFREHIFQMLLAKGSDVQVRGSNGLSCLQMLFNLETHQRETYPEYNNSQLFGFEDFVYSVATSITDIDILNESVTWDASSYRLIGWAILRNNESLAQLLLSKGVDVDLKNLHHIRSGLDVNLTISQMACFPWLYPRAVAWSSRALSRSA
ncbi:Ankyrin-2 [Lachnellula arida]|uniref:Ankyrin-2 n=1 Tax=Lachnellula arida TaxID=1316785 RepID=A0A8T9BLG0_9HELO|nr:Ankyrin-2 [Lachnellula arida]